ncbi:MAG: hypothetical protein JXP34_21680 [Planctomycetes bacterium]|nr:hypothetical protein [Planctomycetota bacterium]
MTDPSEALARAIERDLGGLDELCRELAAAPPAGDIFSRRALASIIHDFYTCCERIFRRIAIELDGVLSEDSGWHRRLLSSMAKPVADVRPAVISKELASVLDEYLGFRHIFRNIYGFELLGDRLERLVAELAPTAARFREAIRAFVAWLRSETDTD